VEPGEGVDQRRVKQNRIEHLFSVRSDADGIRPQFPE
jgi:hypothetical protein